MKQSKQKGGVGMTMRILMLLILVVSAGVFLIKLIDYTELMRQKEVLEQQKEQYIQEIEELNYRLDSPIDYEDIIRLAREKLGLAFPDETVYYSEQTGYGQ